MKIGVLQFCRLGKPGGESGYSWILLTTFGTWNRGPSAKVHLASGNVVPTWYRERRGKKAGSTVLGARGALPRTCHIQLANTPSLRTRPGIAAGPWERGGMQLGPGVGRVTAVEKGRVSIGSASSQPGVTPSPSESLVTSASTATLGGGDQLPIYMSRSDQGPAASKWQSWALAPEL